MVAVLFWIVIAIACFAVEVHTNAFIGVFIGFGAAISFVLAVSGFNFLVQAIVWLGVSALALAALRPFAVKRFQRRRSELALTQPGASTLTNLRGFVESPVGDASHPGRVRIQGELWRAVTDWPAELPDGTPVVVRRALGTTLWVDPS